ncbi:MAG: gamma-glutamyl-gamma-aminobutyrate hydrolase family protein [Sphingopyxis sp.]|nr:gamma-glutamyl-gamma-aminobutyrate hydrolase family protein [Sphingopyxis sp.]
MDERLIDEMPNQVIGEKYASAISDFSDCLPVALWPSPRGEDLDILLERFDGFVFPGSISNVDPDRYDGAERQPPFDLRRDEFALSLARAVVSRRCPALFICRGYQELNVALGGSLRTQLEKRDSTVAHHSEEGVAMDVRYAPLHEVTLADWSALRSIFGTTRFGVNSLHYQGLERVADALVVHGTADDGLPELVAVADHPFAVGVQWHPEYKPEKSAPNRALLEAFGRAVRGELNLQDKRI